MEKIYQFKNMEGTTTTTTTKDYFENKQIVSINDFLEFMNLSCRLNDLINNGRANLINTNNNNNNIVSNTQQTNSNGSNNSKNKKNGTSSQQQQQQQQLNKERYTTNLANTTTGPRRGQFEIDFKKLAQNALINSLYGYLQPSQPQQQQQQQEKQQQSASLSSSVVQEDSSDAQRMRDSKMRTTFTQKYNNGLHPLLTEKLDYVINEGILDAVLPFICPVSLPSVANNNARNLKNKHINNNNNNNNCQPTNNTLLAKDSRLLSCSSMSLAANSSSMDSTCQVNDSEISAGVCTKLSFVANSNARRKSLGAGKLNCNLLPKDTEVVIHVVDEVKNTAKDFTCPQSLLIQKMGYFADVTAGQKLDDMDISVHCDINIFDWLMRWIKHTANLEQGTNSPNEHAPQLDASNVVPILVSASFLQMEPLLLNCLSYCHAHLNDVVRMSSNLSCFNDAIITSLAAMFTNLELEAVRDKRERVTPRLWTKLITSLCEPEAEALRGHFYSLSGLFRCSKCGKYLTNAMKSHISCVPHNLRLNCWGQLVSHHVRDPNWDINVYIAQLFRELKSWRRVYWKLWGHCHFLYCCVCETHFPVNQMTWCRYHPENAIYLGAQGEGRLSGPTGRYPCCSQQAFRYDPMPTPNGCQFREHSVLVSTDRERAILAISQVAAENNMLCESPPMKLKEAIANNEQGPRWQGLCLTTHNFPRPGLFSQLETDLLISKFTGRLRSGANFYTDSSTDSDGTDSPNERRKLKNSYSNYGSSSSDGCESECVVNSRFITPRKVKKRTGRIAYTPGRHWFAEVSARSNQDHQREFEERAMKQIINLASKKSGSELNGSTQTANALGGSFVRLEAEWREQLKQRHANGSNSNATSNTAQFCGVNNSSSLNKKRLPTIPSSNF